MPCLKLARLLMISSLELKGGAIYWRYTNIKVAIVFLVIVCGNANVLPNVRVSCGCDSVILLHVITFMVKINNKCPRTSFNSDCISWPEFGRTVLANDG